MHFEVYLKLDNDFGDNEGEVGKEVENVPLKINRETPLS